MSYAVLWAAGALLTSTAVTVDQGKQQKHQAKLALEETERMNRITEEQTRIATEAAERQAAEQMALARQQGEAAAQEARDRANEAARQQAELVKGNQAQRAAIEEAKNTAPVKATPDVEIRAGVETARRRRRAFNPTSSVRI